MANVIQGRFPEKLPAGDTQSRDDIARIPDTTLASVHNLLEVSRIPWIQEAYKTLQNTPPINGCHEFFDMLLREKRVTIYSDEAEINLASIMVVGDEMGSIWKVSVDTFIRLFHHPPGALVDSALTAYLVHLFDVAEIAMGLIEGRDPDEEGAYVLADIDDVDWIAPEETLACVVDGKRSIDFYEVSLNLDDPDKGAYSSIDNFQEPNSTPLLFLMLHVWKQGGDIGYSDDDIVEIGVFKTTVEGEFGVTMTFARMVREIDAAILRKWPLYGNYQDKVKIRNTFYKHHILDAILPFEVGFVDIDE